MIDAVGVSRVKLILGNKAYSSWSMRPWLLMRAFDIAFDEQVIPLDQPGSAEAMKRFNPTGKVPVLLDGPTIVWDSLAIIEYVADWYPHLAIWPHDSGARAVARSLAAEMHSGFLALRRSLPMNMRRAPKPVTLDPAVLAAVAADIARIETAWHDARSCYAAGGPFLFGAFCAVDAMFAPVVNRFHVYAVPVAPETRAYMDVMMAMPAWRDWQAEADAEGWRLDRIEGV